MAPQLVLLAVVLAARTAVLHGWGGAADARAGRRGQAAAAARRPGSRIVFTGGGVLPEPLAFGLGTAIVALTAFSAARARGDGWAVQRPRDGCRSRSARSRSLPLLAAGWAVGARYFYLPAVGLGWAVAEALAGARRGRARHDRRGAAARWAPCRRRSAAATSSRTTAGSRPRAARSPPALRVGHRVFHIMAASRTSTWR